MLGEQHPLLQLHPPAQRAGGKMIEAFAGTEHGGEKPAQMRRAGLSSSAVAQKQKRGPRTGRPHTQAAAGGEVEDFGVVGDIGDDGGDGLAGQGLLGGPEQFHHSGGAHQDQGSGIKAETGKARPIGQAHFLGMFAQLQIDDGEAFFAEQASGLGQGKAERGAAIAPLIGENLLQQSTGQARKPFARLGCQHGAPIGQHRFALDIGNSVAQRGKALLSIRQAQGADLSVVNKTGTIRLRLAAESSPFCRERLWRDCINAGQDRVTRTPEPLRESQGLLSV